MNKKAESRILWIIFWVCIFIGGFVSAGRNHNGQLTEYGCVERTGGHVDYRTGDGPECTEYGYHTYNEPVIQSFARGALYAVVPGLILGFVVLAINGKLEEHDSKKKSHHTERE